MQAQRDRVFVSMNAAKHVLGADSRIALVAVVIGVMAMPVLHSVWRPWVIAVFIWAVGFMCEKRDPRFFDFFPLRLQLRDRYEAGPKGPK